MTPHYRHSLAHMREQFRAQGVFYTDERLARVLQTYMPADATEVYDPTCGNGNLLAVFPDSVQKYGQELDEAQAQQARERLANSTIATGCTLAAPAFAQRQFRAIVANPPFSTRWQPPHTPDPRFAPAPCLPPPSKADYAFLLHILHYLHPHGTAAVVCFPGILYRGQREGKIRQWLVAQNVIDEVVHVKNGYFEDTKIATAILVLRKDRAADSPVTFRDLETDRTAAISTQQLAAEGYDLSPHRYLPSDKPPRETIDPQALQTETAQATLRALRAHLSFVQATEQLFGHGSLAHEIAQIERVLREFQP